MKINAQKYKFCIFLGEHFSSSNSTTELWIWQSISNYIRVTQSVGNHVSIDSLAWEMLEISTTDMGKIMYIRGGNPCPCQVHHVMKICVYSTAHSHSSHHVSSILAQTNVYKRYKFYDFQSLTLVSTDHFSRNQVNLCQFHFRGREF